MKTVSLQLSSGMAEEQYSLNLRGFLSREEFARRITAFNGTSLKNQPPRFIYLLPLIIAFGAIAFIVPVIVPEQSKWEDRFLNGKESSVPPIVWGSFAIFVVTIIGITIFAVSMQSYRRKLLEALNKQIQDFNLADNPRNINWRIISKTFTTHATYHSDRLHRMRHNQWLLIIEVSQSTIQDPEIVIHNTGGHNGSSQLYPPPALPYIPPIPTTPPPAYESTMKQNYNTPAMGLSS